MSRESSNKGCFKKQASTSAEAQVPVAPTTTSTSTSSHKKPKTIHRCILQRATKSRSHEASLDCHVCKGSYGSYDAYYAHLIDATCAKNQSARLETSPTAGKTSEPRVGSRLSRQKTVDVDADAVGNDDDDVQIEAEFYRDAPTLKPTAAVVVAATTTTTTTATTMSTSSVTVTPIEAVVRRGRPAKLTLAANLLQNPVVQNSPPLSATKRSFPSTLESSDSLSGPLNLSKRPALEVSRTSAEVEMPPLLPIRSPGGHFLVEQHRREKLGSAGSVGGDSSSTETSPNTKESFSETGDVFTSGVTLYELEPAEMGRTDFGSGNKLVEIPKQRSTGFDELVSISESIRKRQQQEEQQQQQHFRPLLIVPGRRRNPEDLNLCPHLSVATMPPISIAENADDQVLF